MTALARYGWDTRYQFYFDEALSLGDYDCARPGRVVRVDRGIARVTDGKNQHALPITGKAAADPPAVGDFVGFDAQTSRLLFVVERRQQLARRSPGSTTGMQMLAANVDLVLLCTPADRLNPAWVERGLTLAWDSGASPVVVVTKADLLDDAAAARTELEARSVGAEVRTVSIHDQASVAALRELLAGAKTAVCIGPSGAGKSSLLNALLGEESVAVGAVRAGDGKGRHTTVRRELHLIPGGGLLIDTPGTRELGLVADAGSQGSGFADIDTLASGCRFADCAHDGEPGCAVIAAVESGQLDELRYQSFHRQQRERRWMAERSQATDHRKRQREKGFQRVVRDVKALKRQRRGG